MIFIGLTSHLVRLAGAGDFQVERDSQLDSRLEQASTKII